MIATTKCSLFTLLLEKPPRGTGRLLHTLWRRGSGIHSCVTRRTASRTSLRVFESHQGHAQRWWRNAHESFGITANEARKSFALLSDIREPEGHRRLSKAQTRQSFEMGCCLSSLRRGSESEGRSTDQPEQGSGEIVFRVLASSTMRNELFEGGPPHTEHRADPPQERGEDSFERLEDLEVAERPSTAREFDDAVPALVPVVGQAKPALTTGTNAGTAKSSKNFRGATLHWWFQLRRKSHRSAVHFA